MWLLCLGLNQNDEDVPRSGQRQKQAARHHQVYNRAFGPCFVFGKGCYAQPPVSGVLPLNYSRVSIKGTIFPEFTYVVDKTKAYEFAKAIGDELRQVEGEFLAPIGMMIFVVVQDGGSIFKALNVTWKQVFLGGVKL